MPSEARCVRLRVTINSKAAPLLVEEIWPGGKAGTQRLIYLAGLGLMVERLGVQAAVRHAPLGGGKMAASMAAAAGQAPQSPHADAVSDDPAYIGLGASGLDVSGFSEYLQSD